MQRASSFSTPRSPTNRCQKSGSRSGRTRPTAATFHRSCRIDTAPALPVFPIDWRPSYHRCPARSADNVVAKVHYRNAWAPPIPSKFSWRAHVRYGWRHTNPLVRSRVIHPLPVRYRQAISRILARVPIREWSRRISIGFFCFKFYTANGRWIVTNTLFAIWRKTDLAISSNCTVGSSVTKFCRVSVRNTDFPRKKNKRIYFAIYNIYNCRSVINRYLLEKKKKKCALCDKLSKVIRYQVLIYLVTHIKYYVNFLYLPIRALRFLGH